MRAKALIGILTALCAWCLPVANTCAGTWTRLAKPAPDAVHLMLLLSDGTVMVANNTDFDNDTRKSWYRLKPDAHGSYINGSWSKLSDMNDTRLFYSSVLLRDGRVFVAGGEYGTGQGTAEIYDPVANSWTRVPVPANLLNPALNSPTTGKNQGFLDSECILLGNGKILVAPIAASTINGTLLYDPVASQWSLGPESVNWLAEAGWVKLPDGSLLTVDPDRRSSERYLPSFNLWLSDEPVPVDLYGSFSKYVGETGPALLLPDGRAFFLGGRGHTALYTPSGNNSFGTWVAGPDIPGGLVAADAPAAMLANGKVLCAVAVAPYQNGNGELVFPQGTSFFEYDYSIAPNGAFSQVASPVGGLTDNNSASYQTLMLDLPDGTVLYSHFGPDLYVYTPDGPPIAAGKPAITSITQNSDGSFHLVGTKLNGISAGAAYGDDAQMDSNYPLVRLTQANGQVFYARTFGWSSTGVATGNQPVSTEFSVPAFITGSCSLVVVANGISSDPVVFLPPAASCTPIPSGLLASWEAEGNSLDSVGTARGAMINGAGFAPGLVGQAFQFDGVNQRVDVTNSAVLAFTGPVTITAWIHRSMAGVQHSILEKYSNSSGGYGLRVNAGDTLTFFTCTDSTHLESVTGATTLAPNVWYHVAGIWDGSHLQVYVNGHLDGFQSLNANPSAGNSPVRIGARGNDAGTPFAGLIDEVCLYNRGLIVTELAAEFAAGSAGKCPPPGGLPQIVAQPQNSSVTNGGTVNLYVLASGNRPLSYRWQLNGADLRNGGRVSGVFGNVLTITGARATDGGDFRVVVSNSQGSITSAPASLVVAEYADRPTLGRPTGSGSFGGLLLAKDGSFYGTTGPGGNYGSVFRWTSDGLFQTEAGFYLTNGSTPGQLIQASDGNFYGTTAAGGAGGHGTVFRISSSGALTTLHNFQGTDGDSPVGGVIQGADGNLYGTTRAGGANQLGTLFRLGTNGGPISILHSFAGGSDGAAPYAGVIQAGDGSFYGTTYNGGTTDRGTIFKCSASAGVQILHSFGTVLDPAHNPADGLNPAAALLEASDGYLYGTTVSGGTNASGAIFRLHLDGTAFAPLYSFGAYSAGATDGGSPRAPLIQTADGGLYGTAAFGGASALGGTVFRLTTDGHFTVLHAFGGGAEGKGPVGALVPGGDGALYGVTTSDGPYGSGTIFRLALSASNQSLPVIFLPPAPQTVLAGSAVNFSVTPAGTGPFAYQWQFGGIPLPGASSATLTLTNVGLADAGGYRVVVGNNFGTVTSAVANLTITSFRTLNSFSGGPDGSSPRSGLSLGNDGRLFGTTYYGGTNGFGTVFCVSPDGAISPLYSFPGGTNGANPTGGLALGPDGNFYGTTYYGGIMNDGTVFRITPEGSLTPLHSFGTVHNGAGALVDGVSPVGTLLLADDGRFYGTTANGGTNSNGTVFRLTTNGVLTELHAFGASLDPDGISLDGGYPVAKLFQGAGHALYGTTLYGGTNNSGTVFTVSTNGSFFSSLHQFSAGGAAAPFFFTNSDGAGPWGSLVQSGDGSLYGTASADGVNGYGTIFKINHQGGFMNLYTFGNFDATGSFQDGARPYAGLILAPDGSLYGTTGSGGARNAGTVFRITDDGAFTLIHSFTGGDDGGNPQGDLVFGPDGNLYGTTSQGGLNGTNGTVFCVLVQREAGGLPRILQPPSSQSLPSGTPAMFQVQVTGTSPLQYQWRLNGTNLADAPGLQGALSPSLQIAELTAADAGNYDVVITNSSGSVTSSVATLTVIPSVFWTNVNGGTWSVPTNWRPNRLPKATDAVYITANGNYTVNLDTSVVVSNLVLGGVSGRQHISCLGGSSVNAVGKLEIGTNGIVDCGGGQLGVASLVCEGTLNWSSGKILAPLTVGPGGALNIPTGSRITLHGSLTNVGMILMAAASSLTLAESGTRIQNLAGGTFILDGDQQSISGAAAVLFQNQGALIKSQGAPSGQASTLSLPVQNNGLVDVQRGTLVFGGTFSGSDGTLNLYIQSPPPYPQFSQIEFHSSAIPGRLQFYYESSTKLIPGESFRLMGFTAGFQPPTLVVPPINVPPNSHWQYTQANGEYVAKLTVTIPGTSPPQTVASGSVVVLRVLLGNENALPPGPPDATTNLFYQWFLNGLALSDNGKITGSQSNILTITGVQGANAGIYQAVISNAFGSVTSDATYLSAYSINWTNTAGGAWETPANWSPNRVPLPSDDVLIAGDQAMTVTVNGPVTVSSLNVGGGLGNATLANNAYSLTITNPVILASNGIVNWSGGTLPADLLVSQGALFNWSGGLLTGSLNQAGGSTVNVGSGQLVGAWNIASNAVLNFLSGTTYLEGSLTNAGTVNWLGGDIYLYDFFSSYPLAGPIINQPGGVWNIQCDQYLEDYSDYGPNAYFANLGIVQKTGNTGVTYVQLPFNNQGQTVMLAGTLRFYDGAKLGGAFSATNGAVIDFYGGGFSYTTPPPVFTGPGKFQLSGGSLTLADDLLRNLQMTGGTVTLGPNFQGGVITNLTLQSLLAGSHTVSGVLNCGGGASGSLAVAAGATLNWTGGIITGSLSQAGGSTVNVSSAQLLGPWNIASNAVLNFVSGTTYLEGSLTNAGTVNWLGGDIYLYDNFNYYPFAGPIINQPGGVWNIQCDQYLEDYSDYGPNAYFANLGTVQKTGNTGVTYVQLPFNNQGQTVVEAGTLRFYDGAKLGGAFSATNGAVLDFYGGNFSYSTPPPLFNGPGMIRMSGGSLTLTDDLLPNLQMTGGTVTLGTNFQGGVITNLTLQGLLAGSYTVTGVLNSGGGVSGSLAVAEGATLNWTGGIITGSLDQAGASTVNVSSAQLLGHWNIASNAVLNFVSGTTYLAGSLTNAGTVNWLAGDIYLYDYYSYYPLAGPIINQPGGVWNILCDQYLEDYNDYGPNAYFTNLGTVQKIGNNGITYMQVPFNNQGETVALAGTLRFYDGAILGGIFNATNGAAIDFRSGNFSPSTLPPVFNGNGMILLSGGSLTLVDDLLPNLQMTGGTVTLGPNFQGGVITNLTLQAVLSGNHTVSGVLNCGGGVSGNLAVVAGATLNWTGGIITGSLSQAGGSTVNVSSAQLLGPWNIASNAVLNFVSGTTYLAGSLTNAGMVNWLGGDIYLYDYFNSYPLAGPIINQPGGVWNIQCDQYLEDYNDYGPNAYFANLGTVRKTANTGVTYIQVPFNNQGQTAALAGTLRFYDGVSLGGTFSATNGAAVDFYGGNFRYTSPPPVFNGPGKFLLSGGSLTLLDDLLPNLQMTGGTVTLGAKFQGGVITNLTLQALLAGSHTVNGVLNCGGGVSGNLAVAPGATLNWTGGIITGSLSQAGRSTVNVSSGQLLGPWNIASNAVLNFVSGTTYLAGSLTNAGTVNWLGGDIYLDDIFSFYPLAGPIINQSGGVWNIQCDQYLEDYSDYGPNAYFANWGTVQKTGNNGVTYMQLPFNNQGHTVVQAGTLLFFDGAKLGGTFSATNGALINFYNGGFSYTTPPPVFTGLGRFQLSGGSLTLVDDQLPNLQMTGGTVTLGPNFQGGVITNLTLHSLLAGSHTVSGVLNCGGGVSGSLAVTEGATLNWTGGIITGSLDQVGASTVNVSSGQLQGPWNIASNSVLNFVSGTTYLEGSLTNAGTVNWLGGDIYLYDNFNYFPFAGPIINQPGGVWNIQCDQYLEDYSDYGPNAYFANLGTVRKNGNTGVTYVQVPFANRGTLEAFVGTLSFTAGLSETGGSLVFGLGGSGGGYGRINIPGRAHLAGIVGAVWLGTPRLGTFDVLSYGFFQGAFDELLLPPVTVWQTNYGPTGFSLGVTALSSLQIVGQPASATAAEVLTPTVVQLHGPDGNPARVAQVPVTLGSIQGVGTLSGTLTRLTDTNGLATFDDVAIAVAGTTVLQASAPGYLPCNTQPITIIPGTAAQLRLVTAVSSPQTNGLPFQPAPVVQIQDAWGNVISNATAPINALLSAGSGSLTGLSLVNCDGIHGSASFPDLGYALGSGNLAESIVLQFVSPGLTPVSTAAIQILPSPSGVTSNLLVNGSFESGANPPVSWYRSLFADDTSIEGWKVSVGRIDWSGVPFHPLDGSLSAQLVDNGTSISQSFATVPGSNYLVRFSLQNPNVVNTPTTVAASLGGSTYVAVLPVGPSYSWVNYSARFTAASTVSTLTFANVDGGHVGPSLDSVSVQVAGPAILPPTLSIAAGAWVGQLVFTWISVPGSVYQLQYKTTLEAGDWIPLGSSVAATNGTQSVTEAATADAQRFYRLLILP